MKKIVLFLIFIFTVGLLKAQYALGTTGQSMIPTAEMQRTGTFMGGANFLPEQITPTAFDYPTLNYYVNMTLFSFVELGYRLTLYKLPNRDGTSSYRNQDRSSTIRIRVLKEGKYLPALVVGMDDVFSEGSASGYWGSYYGVVTKTLKSGAGDEWALTVGGYIPHAKNAFNKGPFGGIRYTPAFCPDLKLMGEYDSRGWNVGGAMRFWKHLSVNVFTREFTCVSAGIRYECTLIH